MKNPAWWFTVFFVGIVASIFAGFLKDWIGNVVSKVSIHLRIRRDAKLERREILFEALANNETFLVLSMIRLVGLSIISILLFATYSFLPGFLEIKEILCQATPAASSCKSFNPSLSKIVISVIGSLTIFVNYTATSRFSLVMTGLRRYRKKNNLPRVN